MKTEFSVARIFSDNMVLQRNACIPVWGTGEPGDNVEVSFAPSTGSGQGGQSKKGKVGMDGRWMIHLDPMPASCEPRKLLVSSSIENRQLAIENVLLGEVWIAGGQSNMEFALADTSYAGEEIPKADDPELRCYKVPRIPYVGADLENPAAFSAKPEWSICTPGNAGTFPAVAYHFAVEIRKTLKVPVGIVSCAWGGTSASSWMSEKYLSADKDIKVYLDEYQRLIAGLDMDKYLRDHEAYNSSVASFNRIKVETLAKNKDIGADELNRILGPYPWPPPAGPKNFQTPSGLYHTMLEKISPYAAKGVIFYQGESDVEKAPLYCSLFGNMIQNWRDDWKNPKLPFLFTQITSYGCDGKLDGEDWAQLREQQLLASRKIPDTYMAVSIDCGDAVDIHPKNKRPIGERLALIARSKVYGEKIECSGPELRKMEIGKGKAILHFDHVGDGLAAREGQLVGFRICDVRRNFADAIAVIKGRDIVEVSSGGIENPVAVRFGWSNFTRANLVNSHGLPASPFRTDA